MFTFWSSELKLLVDCIHNDRSYPKVELPLLSPPGPGPHSDGGND